MMVQEVVLRYLQGMGKDYKRNREGEIFCSL